MRRKIIALIVWILFTMLYCWNFGDVGRSIGARTTNTIEMYSEMMVEYGGTDVNIENSGKAIGDIYSYRTYGNLESRFKGDFLFVGITTAIYFTISITCFYFAFIRK